MQKTKLLSSPPTLNSSNFPGVKHAFRAADITNIGRYNGACYITDPQSGLIVRAQGMFNTLVQPPGAPNGAWGLSSLSWGPPSKNDFNQGYTLEGSGVIASPGTNPFAIIVVGRNDSADAAFPVGWGQSGASGVSPYQGLAMTYTGDGSGRFDGSNLEGLNGAFSFVSPTFLLGAFASVVDTNAAADANARQGFFCDGTGSNTPTQSLAAGTATGSIKARNFNGFGQVLSLPLVSSTTYLYGVYFVSFAAATGIGLNGAGTSHPLSPTQLVPALHWMARNPLKGPYPLWAGLA